MREAQRTGQPNQSRSIRSSAWIGAVASACVAAIPAMSSAARAATDGRCTPGMFAGDPGPRRRAGGDPLAGRARSNGRGQRHANAGTNDIGGNGGPAITVTTSSTTFRDDRHGESERHPRRPFERAAVDGLRAIRRQARRGGSWRSTRGSARSRGGAARSSPTIMLRSPTPRAISGADLSNDGVHPTGAAMRRCARSPWLRWRRQRGEGR